MIGRTHRPAAPLSPVLLAGLAARPLPPALLQPFLAFGLRAIGRRHPGLFGRLAGIRARTFLIDPVDLPFVLVLETDPGRPALTALGEEAAKTAEAPATIRGPLMSLIDLLEGRLDGDALFFSRDLAIEGDTEAVVALRNAIDDAEIDVLADVLSVLGPLAGPARLAAEIGAGVVSRAARDLETLRDAVIAPALRRGDAGDAEPRETGETVSGLERHRRPARRAGGASPAKAKPA